jgi:hypothetical protein
MARIVVEHVTCDFCGYSGSLARPVDFRHYEVEGVDLCKWCVASGRAAAWFECGGHRVTFATPAGTGWSCSCGATSGSEFDHAVTSSLAARFPMMGVARRLAELHAEGYAPGPEPWLTVGGAR